VTGARAPDRKRNFSWPGACSRKKVEGEEPLPQKDKALFLVVFVVDRRVRALALRAPPGRSKDPPLLSFFSFIAVTSFLDGAEWNAGASAAKPAEF